MPVLKVFASSMPSTERMSSCTSGVAVAVAASVGGEPSSALTSPRFW
jgi:hypothetical protein